MYFVVLSRLFVRDCGFFNAVLKRKINSEINQTVDHIDTCHL